MVKFMCKNSFSTSVSCRYNFSGSFSLARHFAWRVQMFAIIFSFILIVVVVCRTALLKKLSSSSQLLGSNRTKYVLVFCKLLIYKSKEANDFFFILDAVVVLYRLILLSLFYFNKFYYATFLCCFSFFISSFLHFLIILGIHIYKYISLLFSISSLFCTFIYTVYLRRFCTFFCSLLCCVCCRFETDHMYNIQHAWHLLFEFKKSNNENTVGGAGTRHSAIRVLHTNKQSNKIKINEENSSFSCT